jgi:hypothetical protein
VADDVVDSVELTLPAPELEVDWSPDDVVDVAADVAVDVIVDSVELDDEFEPAVQLALNPV